MGHVMVYLFYCLENTILQYPAYPTFLFLPAPARYILTSPIIAHTVGNNVWLKVGGKITVRCLILNFGPHFIYTDSKVNIKISIDFDIKK